MLNLNMLLCVEVQMNNFDAAVLCQLTDCCVSAFWYASKLPDTRPADVLTEQ